MKASPALARVVGTSHQRVARVDLHAADGQLVAADLPVTDARVVGTAVDPDRWTCEVTLAGDVWVPLTPADPLSGMARTHLRVFMGAVVDTVPTLLEVARVVPVESRVRRATDQVTVDVVCAGPAGWLETVRADYTSAAATTCQGLIVKAVTDNDPPAWSGLVDDTSTPVSMPADYTADGTAWDVVEDMAALANVTAYFDAGGTLVIRDPMPDGATDWDVTVGVGATLVAYDLEVGRAFGFANDIRVVFTADDGTERVGRASQATGPLSVTDAGRVTFTESRTGKPTQAVADARAAALLPAALRAWSTVLVTAVPDPRLEPDDTIVVELDDRTTYGRITRVELPSAPTDPMLVGVRAFPDGTYTPPLGPLYPALTLHPADALYPRK